MRVKVWVYSGLAIAVLTAIALSHTQSGALPATLSSVSAPAASPIASDTDPLGQMISWNAAENGDPKTYRIGAIAITLSSHASGDGPPIPVLRLAQGADAFDAEGGPGFDTAQASFGVGRLDAASPQAQILFATFSGGAHCCTAVSILDRTAKGWISINAGDWDGGVLDAFPSDLNGDGSADLVFGDDRFAYAFAAYAGSPKPPRIFNYHTGTMTEVSTQAGFKPYLEGLLPDLKTGCEAHANGACAAFVAISARLGQFDEAWRLMLKNYDPQSGWALPTGCRTALVKQVCPDGQALVFRDYPGALTWFLRDAGYLFLPGQGLTTPSFDCRAVQIETLLLVCADRDLAEADKALEIVYRQALARAADAEALRAEQRQWVQDRDASRPDRQALYGLYIARINALRAPDG